MNANSENFSAAERISHVKPLSGLNEKVIGPHTAVIVIDVQNDFCADEGTMAKEGFDMGDAQAMAERLPDFLSTARGAGALIVFVRNVYSSDQNYYLSDVWLEQAARARVGSYTKYPVCPDGTWEGDYYRDVCPEPNDARVIKHRFNAFLNTDLDTILRANGIRTLIMTGVATNVCVESTARDGFMRDYYIVFPSDGTAAYSRDDHDATLRNIGRFFGEVCTLSDVEKIWMSNEAK